MTAYRDEMVGRLVSFENKRGLILDGMLCEAGDAVGTVVHIHGSYGNFYQNQFVRTMANVYTQCKLNFLSFNLSAHDGIAEGYGPNDEFVYVGGAVVEFDSCVDDIAGAVDFARGCTDRIILQGHSLGCDRVLHYMLETGDHRQFVLLCPCDSYELHKRWTGRETVDDQRVRLGDGGKAERGIVLLDGGEYGLKQEDWTYEIPVTRRALLSIMEGAPFRLIRPEEGGARFVIEAAGAVYLGGQDPLLTVRPEAMFDYFEKRARALRRIYVAGGDHLLQGCAVEVGRTVASWVNEAQ